MANLETVLPQFLVLLIDLLILGLFLLALVPLALYRKAAYAVLKRNFVSYFSTPTGYVFLCIFVLLSSFAAFWPHEFFASNLATLDQLNSWLPVIMLLFIPTITMSIWADERRQGTDELLLTIPADDFDIVLGKYLAAASIFSASLLFSQLANFSVLNFVAKGGVDLGLFYTTYLGYWFMGMAMISIGMVASFLTTNLTVGFVLGVLFNAPLALAQFADVIISDSGVAQTISEWSMASQFADFGRGVVSIAAITYFTMIIAVGIYLSMVLIGRRHWVGGRDGRSMAGHYLLRVLALIVIAFGATSLLANHDFLRHDATSERISKLSPDTYKILKSLKFDQPVLIEAYISKSLPESYVRTKYDLINMLRELRAAGGSNIKVNINDRMEPFSEESRQAEDRYGIRPEVVQYEAYGAARQEQIFLAAAFTCGLERVVVPFFGPGTPVEYELVRSIATVADDSDSTSKTASKDEKNKAGEALHRSRKTIGFFGTDAQFGVEGGINFAAGTRTPTQLLVSELRKQYHVEDVDPNSDVDKSKIDVLVVVQPSSLSPTQLPHLLKAIKDGIPTAIFEDPAPVRFQGQSNPYVPGTDFPKRSPGMMFGMQGPQPKCEIGELWDLLGVRMVRALRGEVDLSPLAPRPEPNKVTVKYEPFHAIVWQHYNPYLKDPNIPDIVVIANPAAKGGENTFNKEVPAVSNLREVLFMAPGAFVEAKKKSSLATDLKLEFTPLVQTGTESGLQWVNDPGPGGLRQVPSQDEVKPMEVLVSEARLRNLQADPRLKTQREYALAAWIHSKDNSDEKAKGNTKEATPPEAGSDSQPKVNVVLVSDIDMIDSLFFLLRQQPSSGGIDYAFQNVTFTLNLIDMLAGDDRFINIRKRTRQYGTLRLVEEKIRFAEERTQEEIDKFQESVNTAMTKAENDRRKIIVNLEKDVRDAQQKGQLDSRKVRELEQKLQWQTEHNKSLSEKDAERRTLQLRERLRQIQRDLEVERRQIQNQYKGWAVFLPTIPPLLIGLAVFIRRRMREREGVSKNRLR